MAKKKNEEKTRAKWWRLLIYGEKVEEVERLLNEWKVCKYVGILHDADTPNEHMDDDPDYCPKPHYHFVIHTQNQSERQTVLNKLNLEERFIRGCDNYKGAFCYLVHETEECRMLEKPPVPMERLFGSAGLLASCRDTIMTNRGQSPVDRGVLPLLAYIENHSFEVTPAKLLTYAIEMGLAKSYKAYSSTLLREVDNCVKARQNALNSITSTEILISDTRELLRQDMEIQFREYCTANGLAVACGEYTLESLVNSNRKYHYYSKPINA